MSELIQVSVKSLGSDPTTNTPVVILQEQDGERVLPIWIGPCEASAIALVLKGVKYPRPMTHDLLVSMVQSLDGELESVVISLGAENTYFAEMLVLREGEVISVDARPSDSIAVALRMSSEIFVHDGLLKAPSTETIEQDAFPIEEQAESAAFRGDHG